MSHPVDEALIDRVAWYDVARAIWWKQVTWGEVGVMQADRQARGVPLRKFYTERAKERPGDE